MAKTKAAEVSEDTYSSAVFEDGGSVMIDLSNIEEMRFEAIPKGIYDAVVDSCEYKISKNSGKPMFEFQFEINGGDYNGRKLYFYASFSAAALAGTKTALNRIDPTIFAGPFNPQKIADDGILLGKAVRLKIKHEDYNGEPQARIQSILAPAEGGAPSGDSFF